MFALILPLTFTNILFILTIFVVTMVIAEFYQEKKSQKVIPKDVRIAPSPRKLPVIGHLHLLGGYEVPYQAFSSLGKQYGNVINLQLGNVKCVVINGMKNIREALVTKGHHFDSRPNFQRYQQLFSGNKENSLAFCDWSETQKARRDMLKSHTFPRAFTNKFSSLDQLVSSGTKSMLSEITPASSTELKPIVLRHCANIFLSHFCSKNFDSTNTDFVEMVEAFDEIFYEVNQGHAADFLPFLMPFQKKNLERMNTLAQNIRQFIDNEVIGSRFEDFDVENEPDDYVESLIQYVKTDEACDLTWSTALFALEDIVGGHSAIGNFVMKMFGFLVREPEVQKKIQKEIENVVGESRDVSIGDRNMMPYTEAVIFEAIRLIASPIVPRVANQDSTINGYHIEKGSLLFLNNHDLSMSDELWDNPEKFMPERFIRDGKLIKPEHFLPFGGGRRSCLGYRLVQLISFAILGAFLQKFTILPLENEDYKVPIGSLALKKDTFKFKFLSR